MSHERYSVLSEYVHLIIQKGVVLCVLLHREPKGLAYHVVERDSQEEPSKHNQHYPIHAVELSPLSLVLEQVVDLYSLSPLLH